MILPGLKAKGAGNAARWMVIGAALGEPHGVCEPSIARRRRHDLPPRGVHAQADAPGVAVNLQADRCVSNMEDRTVGQLKFAAPEGHPSTARRAFIIGGIEALVLGC
jgi:hypothetical protein